MESVVLRNVSIVNPLLGMNKRNNYVSVVFQKYNDGLRFIVKSSMVDHLGDEKIHVRGFVYPADKQAKKIAKYASNIDIEIEKEIDVEEYFSSSSNIAVGEFYWQTQRHRNDSVAQQE